MVWGIAIGLCKLFDAEDDVDTNSNFGGASSVGKSKGEFAEGTCDVEVEYVGSSEFPPSCASEAARLASSSFVCIFKI